MSKKQQLGVNRDMLRQMFGDQATELFSKPKPTKGTGEHKKMTRILVWPNITFKVEELEKDSYVQTIYRMIKELSKHRDDLWWELVLPRVGRTFSMFDEFNNVDLIIHCASMTNAEKSFGKEKEMFNNNINCN